MIDRIQARVGILFSLFSLVLVVSKLFFAIIHNNLQIFISNGNLIFVIYVLLFGMTIFWKSIISKLIQIGIISVEAILSLSCGVVESFFGLSMLISVILICFSYGFFNKLLIGKVISLPILFYILFIFLPLRDNDNKYLIAFQWDMFICFFIFLMWLVFKDTIKHNKEYNDSMIKKYNDKVSILQNQLELSIKTGIDLLDIIKSSDKNKGDNCD